VLILDPNSTSRRARRAGFARAATLLVVGILMGLVLQAALDRFAADPTARQLEEVDRVRELIERSFVRPLESEDLYDAALRGMLDGLDAYSKYYDNVETKVLQRQTTGLYDGIGVLFAPSLETWHILYPMPDSPAEEAGFRVGDRLVTVAGELAEELPIDELRAHFADGSKGTVEVLVEGLDGERRTLDVQPARVVNPTLRQVRVIKSKDPARADEHVGYLSIESFSRRTFGEFDAAVEGLRARGARRLVIDLRGNGGGVVSSAVGIANRFVRQGALLRIESRNGTEVSVAQPDQAVYADMPVAILMDGHSASAAEILAGALQDHRAAVLVGERSYGKGTVQTLTPLRELDGTVRITTSVYRTPSGRLIERSLQGAWEAGLEPDLALAPTDAERRDIDIFLASYGAPLDLRHEVLSWQEHSGLQLLPPPPADPVLDAAIQLLTGERPSHVASTSE